jgi:NTP pyrophosphatase (non-canonical NTP hydrolase)
MSDTTESVEVLRPTELRYFNTLREANEARQKEWDAGNQISLTYRATELAGELGEACNIIKKLERERLGIRGSRDTVEHLAEELADIEICNDLIAMMEGIDLEAAKVAKFNATSEKMGLATRLRALPQGELGWQDWKTAPTDGSVILAYRPDAGVFQAHYVSPADIFRGHPDHESDDTEPQWWTTDGDDLESDLPTHWRSLPTPPVSVKG